MTRTGVRLFTGQAFRRRSKATMARQAACMALSRHSSKSEGGAPEVQINP